MGYMTKVRHVKHCKPKNRLKRYLCDWCGEKIADGESMYSYGYFEDGNGNTVRMHPECYAAMLDEGVFAEFSPGDNRRGCNCGRDAGCKRCKENENKLRVSRRSTMWDDNNDEN